MSPTFQEMLKAALEKEIAARRIYSTDDYPHKCPKCGEHAYVGMSKVSCVMDTCENFDDSQMKPISPDLVKAFVDEILEAEGWSWNPRELDFPPDLAAAGFTPLP